MKKGKRRRQLTNKRKRFIMLNSFLAFFLVLGIGYSALGTNLNILGSIQLKKQDCQVNKKLYNVLKCEASNGDLARKYTGNHQDSMAGVGSKNIYHWFSDNKADKEAIQDKNNVIFANHCWQIIRTTDTGGVKMLYNGEVEDGKCLNTRDYHVGYNGNTTKSLSTSYYYGTSYSYDKTNDVFSLDGTITTGTIQTGQYTCLKTTSTETCSTLYLVDSISSGTTYNVIQLSGDSHYSFFGTIQFNLAKDSPAYVGYMHNEVYPIDKKNIILDGAKKKLGIKKNSMASGTKYYYGDNITYSSGKYYLTNPTEIGWGSSNLNTINGKYTCLSDNSSTYTVSADYNAITQSDYINITNDSTYPYTYDSSENMWKSTNQGVNSSTATIKFSIRTSGVYKLNYIVSSETSYDKATFYKDGTSLGTFSGDKSGEIDLGDLTPTNVIQVNYQKDSSVNSGADTTSFYLSKGENATQQVEAARCDNAYYVLNTTRDNGYMYTEELTNGNTTPYKKIRLGDINSSGTIINAHDVAFEDYYNNYEDYVGKYICSDLLSTNCSPSQPLYITKATNTIIYYMTNDRVYSYGKSFTYTNNKYVLSDKIMTGADDNHHYTCFNREGECTNLYYIHYLEPLTYQVTGNCDAYYITLTGGDSVEVAMNKMLYNDDVNNINSMIKTGVEAWYKKYMLAYDNYIEDTIFCNDRRIMSLNGWNPNGGSILSNMSFRNYDTIVDLSCENETDKFSTLNSKARLEYKVGLFSSPELNILTSGLSSSYTNFYWLGSPYNFNTFNIAIVKDADFYGIPSSDSVGSNDGVRPAVSLKPGIEFTSGTGTMDDPYVVKLD